MCVCVCVCVKERVSEGVNVYMYEREREKECVCVCVCVCTCAGFGLPVHMFVKVCFGKTLKRPCFHEGPLVLKQNLDFVGFPLLPHRYCIQLYSDKHFSHAVVWRAQHCVSSPAWAAQRCSLNCHASPQSPKAHRTF